MGGLVDGRVPAVQPPVLKRMGGFEGTAPRTRPHHDASNVLRYIDPSYYEKGVAANRVPRAGYCRR